MLVEYVETFSVDMVVAAVTTLVKAVKTKQKNSQALHGAANSYHPGAQISDFIVTVLQSQTN